MYPMHTDAAFSGQGLASELLQLSKLSGYSVNGSIHVIVNNKIGFTTVRRKDDHLIIVLISLK